ncbi:molybdopterin-binding protein [Methylocapsa sp. S129]|uniref:molybdopterin-binding protein n=1 Tax=Methylocapsa sp. S129 TaxID=1641869 RepID=UPI001FED6134|nr:molybdopterin-binding protein [Methylocapsa sp. S129]
MKFGPVAVAEAFGAIVAHAVRRDGLVLKKGQVVTSEHQAALKAAGVAEIIAARLDPGDVGEDEAARRLSARLAGPNLRCEGAFTGRVNLFAEKAGLVIVDAARIAGVNGVDEAITAATLAPFRAVAPGDMVATVKIIPFAVPGVMLDAALEAAGKGAVRIAAFRPLRVGVVSTLLPGLKPSVVAKTLRILADRLEPAGARIVREERVAHEPAALARALIAIAPDCDVLLVFGASAITDRRDVIPAAVEAIGGRVDHFGMPVDPGNLLLLGAHGRLPIIGAPGCARSPKENGFDWVLQRVLADVPVKASDIMGMGVGGLLMEIASRPQPRLGDG